MTTTGFGTYAYTVLLLYPNEDPPQSYLSHVFSENPGQIGYWSRLRPVVALMSEAYARTVDKIAENSRSSGDTIPIPEGQKLEKG